MKVLWTGLIFVSLISAGCGVFTDKVTIESDTTWDGYFGNRSIAGSGNSEVNLPTGVSNHCATIQKTSKTGYLRARISNTGVLNPNSEAVTYAPYGIVTVCSGS